MDIVKKNQKKIDTLIPESLLSYVSTGQTAGTR